jgi:trigger factor
LSSTENLQDHPAETSAEHAVDTATAAAEESASHAPETNASGHDHSHESRPTLNPECTRQVEVEVSAEEVNQAFERVTRQYRRQARIPGFRAGKVPESVIRRKFADAIRQDVLEQILPNSFRHAIAREALQPVSQPQVTSLHLTEGQPMKYQAAFEVLPPIDISGYDQIRVPRPEAALKDEEYDAELSRLRESHAIMEPVEEERPLRDGDFALIKFTGLIQPGAEGEEPKPIEGDDAPVEIGGANTVEAFSEALRGANVGDSKHLEVTYAEDFQEKRLAGKTVSYDVEIKGIRRKILPELNDEFAKQLGESEGIDALRTKLREQMADSKRRHMESEAKDELLTALVERFQFPVPESLVQQQVDARLERGLRALAQQGMSTEQMRRLDFDRLREAQRDSAISEVKSSLILDRIAEQENIEVSDDEVNTQVQMLAYQAREPYETVRKRLTDDGGLARIREQLRREKTLNQLFERLAA